jgi:hypothetical protein
MISVSIGMIRGTTKIQTARRPRETLEAIEKLGGLAAVL